MSDNKLKDSDIRTLLSEIIHPALGKDLVSLNLVDDIKILEDNGLSKVRIKLRFPSEDSSVSDIKQLIFTNIGNKYPNVKVSVMELISEKKSPKKLNLQKSNLDSVGKIIAIASGKGGVGKSTVAVNLAVTLADMGYRVGLLDADVYGPSIPIMTKSEGFLPEIEQDQNGEDMIIPLDKYSVKWISIGYFASPEQALIWRGPMANSALKQLLFQVKWGELDFLLIDLPPGTGDIHISIVNEAPLSGAIIVTTPQEVAMADVRKGIGLFLNDKINVPILGVIENMSWFTPEELPDNRYYIFGKGGGKKISESFGVPLLGEIPITLSIREDADQGVPSSLNHANVKEAFVKIAEKIR